MDILKDTVKAGQTMHGLNPMGGILLLTDLVLIILEV